MKLTRAAEYGILALLYLASQPMEKVCFIGEISAARGVPDKYLAKILQTLARGGILKSHRGAKGGFSLARLPEEINLKQIIECIEGPTALNICLVGPDTCQHTGGCPVHPVWEKAQRVMLEVLAGADLKSLSGGVSASPK